MRTAALKQTGRDVAAPRSSLTLLSTGRRCQLLFHAFIAPFHAALHSPPFLPFPPLFRLCPATPCDLPPSRPRRVFSLYPHLELRTIGIYALLHSPRPSVFIYFSFPSHSLPCPSPLLALSSRRFVAPPRRSARARLIHSLPSIFVLPLSAQLFNLLPRTHAARLGATSPLSYLPLLNLVSSRLVASLFRSASCSSLLRNYPIRAIRPRRAATIGSTSILFPSSRDFTR